MARKLIKLFSFLVVAFILWFVAEAVYFYHSPLITQKNGLHFVVKPGMNVRTLSDALNKSDVLADPWKLRVLSRIFGYDKHLQAGEYLFPQGSKPIDILKQINDGDIIYHDFMITGGTTFKEMMRNLDAAAYVKHTVKGMRKSKIMQKLGFEKQNPEGRFYPETYFVAYGVTDLSILKRAHEMMQKRLDYAWKHRAKGLPFRNVKQALTAASLIEKEAHLQTELPIIASVLINRLKKRMHLQFDTTVIYAMGDKLKGPLKGSNLKYKSQYNTYLHYGLPPGPICMPDLVAIEAVLHPANTNYIYFVAKGDGSHQFSKTFKEQDAAIKKYLL